MRQALRPTFKKSACITTADWTFKKNLNVSVVDKACLICWNAAPCSLPKCRSMSFFRIGLSGARHTGRLAMNVFFCLFVCLFVFTVSKAHSGASTHTHIFHSWTYKEILSNKTKTAIELGGCTISSRSTLGTSNIPTIAAPFRLHLVGHFRGRNLLFSMGANLCGSSLLLSF